MVVVENVIAVVLVLYLRFSVFFSFRSFYFCCANKMGMTMTATSFACLYVDVIHHEGSGITEVSNSHRIPPIYCSGCLSSLEVFGDFVGGGNVSDSSTFSVRSFIKIVCASLLPETDVVDGSVRAGTR